MPIGLIDLVDAVEPRAGGQAGPADAGLTVVRVIGAAPTISAASPAPAARRVAGLIARDDDRHIVDGAAFERQLDQGVAGLLRDDWRLTQRRISSSWTWSVSPSLQMTNESPDWSAPLRHLQLGHRRRRRSRGSRRCGRPGLRLLGGDAALREQLLHLGVVARQLHDLAVAHHVDAAVARPHAGIVAVEGEQDRERRADDRAALAAELVAVARWPATTRPRTRSSSSAADAGCSIDASASTRVRLARSPASWPPMPSATAQMPASGRAR